MDIRLPKMPMKKPATSADERHRREHVRERDDRQNLQIRAENGVADDLIKPPIHEEGQHRAEQPQQTALHEERQTDEAVGRADHLHNRDLLAAIHHGQLDCIGNDDERNDQQHGGNRAGGDIEHGADRGQRIGRARGRHRLPRRRRPFRARASSRRPWRCPQECDELVAHGAGVQPLIQGGVGIADEVLQRLVARLELRLP